MVISRRSNQTRGSSLGFTLPELLIVSVIGVPVTVLQKMLPLRTIEEAPPRVNGRVWPTEPLLLRLMLANAVAAGKSLVVEVLFVIVVGAGVVEKGGAVDVEDEEEETAPGAPRV